MTRSLPVRFLTSRAGGNYRLGLLKRGTGRPASSAPQLWERVKGGIASVPMMSRERGGLAGALRLDSHTESYFAAVLEVTGYPERPWDTALVGLNEDNLCALS